MADVSTSRIVSAPLSTTSASSLVHALSPDNQTIEGKPGKSTPDTLASVTGPIENAAPDTFEKSGPVLLKSPERIYPGDQKGLGPVVTAAIWVYKSVSSLINGIKGFFTGLLKQVSPMAGSLASTSADDLVPEAPSR